MKQVLVCRVFAVSVPNLACHIVDSGTKIGDMIYLLSPFCSFNRTLLTSRRITLFLICIRGNGVFLCLRPNYFLSFMISIHLKRPSSPKVQGRPTTSLEKTSSSTVTTTVALVTNPNRFEVKDRSKHTQSLHNVINITMVMKK